MDEMGSTRMNETKRDDRSWQARWITDGLYHFAEEKTSPVPMKFRRRFTLNRPVSRAEIYATAMGIYELEVNRQRVGDRYFAPGFTSYETHLQYQTYDITGMLHIENTLTATVSGGWAVGSFTFLRKNRITADRQALLLEIRLRYAEGTEEVIGTDESWEVTEDGPLAAADLYDGEIFDAAFDEAAAGWHSASEETLRVHPQILAEYGAPVRAHERFRPVSCAKVANQLIYDFGQNLAGVVSLTVRGREGQRITVRHAEVLNPDGTLSTAPLRSAKAQLIYTCREGIQTYSPRFTYMGFRYAGVEGIDETDVEIEALALYSDVKQIGSFSCSDERLNRLQQNIIWGAKSNFVDIPTDCPQRDERMGWTGDIALFAPTACFNFDLRRFLYKWLLDMEAEQTESGSIPTTIPSHGFSWPDTMPAEIPVDFWGDASVLVPWAMYRAYGDESLLRRFYPMMRRYVDACAAQAALSGNPYIWDTDYRLHFGDWVAPDTPSMEEWQKRSPWTATASLFHTAGIVAKAASCFGYEEDAERYRELCRRVAEAYADTFTEGSGKLLNEFQTGYVLPLAFGMFDDATASKAAAHLAKLAETSDHCVGTGFPGTPYLLFALADHGQAETACKMLMNTKCPSWLYEVEHGATTIWERWDGLDEDGQCPIGADGLADMVSYNHYASGAVGDFLYRRVAGLEAAEPGYKRLRVRPLIVGGLTYARAEIETPYGVASVGWELQNGLFSLSVEVPEGCECEVILPDGSVHETANGKHAFTAKVSA